MDCVPYSRLLTLLFQLLVSKVTTFCLSLPLYRVLTSVSVSAFPCYCSERFSSSALGFAKEYQVWGLDVSAVSAEGHGFNPKHLQVGLGEAPILYPGHVWPIRPHPYWVLLLIYAIKSPLTHSNAMNKWPPKCLIIKSSVQFLQAQGCGFFYYFHPSHIGSFFPAAQLFQAL